MVLVAGEGPIQGSEEVICRSIELLPYLIPIEQIA